MTDRYKMQIADNILWAKRNIVDSIYKESRLEGIAVTFPQTQEIYEGRSVAGLSVDDIIKVNNLKHSWQFVFDTLDYPIDLRYIKQLNHEVGNGVVIDAGYIRNVDVQIGGTTWRPELPSEEAARDQIEEIMNSKTSATEKAVNVMLYIMRSQLFMDGNKRTAQLAANQIMIANGCGIISVPVEKISEFTELLVKYYETNKTDQIKRYIGDYCISGFEGQDRTQETFVREDFVKYVTGQDGGRRSAKHIKIDPEDMKAPGPRRDPAEEYKPSGENDQIQHPRDQQPEL